MLTVGYDLKSKGRAGYGTAIAVLLVCSEGHLLW
jgi:hypothetical protein